MFSPLVRELRSHKSCNEEKKEKEGVLFPSLNQELAVTTSTNSVVEVTGDFQRRAIKGHAVFTLSVEYFWSLELPDKKSSYPVSIMLVRTPIGTVVEPVLQPAQPRPQS